jgi:hypothetical protein
MESLSKAEVLHLLGELGSWHENLFYSGSGGAKDRGVNEYGPQNVERKG